MFTIALHFGELVNFLSSGCAAPLGQHLLLLLHLGDLGVLPSPPPLPHAVLQQLLLCIGALIIRIIRFVRIFWRCRKKPIRSSIDNPPQKDKAIHLIAIMSREPTIGGTPAAKKAGIYEPT